MPHAAIKNSLARFQRFLVGTWSNAALPNAKNNEGSAENPLSYNVMPLPQDGGNNGAGYILKNFTYHEIVKFNSDADVALPATAPNRSGDMCQLPTALFYQQQVYFAEGPDKNEIVHVENGAWLNITTGNRLIGPYAAPKVVTPNTQPADITIAKQMSVPHGNSILALGSFDAPVAGAPEIPDAASVLPTPSGLNTAPYKTKLDGSNDYQNPQPEFTANVNAPLQKAVSLIRPNSYIHWQVTTAKLPNGQCDTLNIPFEQRIADVDAYSAEYWLLSVDGGSTYPLLAYSQNITMRMNIGGAHYEFPHITSNVVTKVK